MTLWASVAAVLQGRATAGKTTTPMTPANSCIECGRAMTEQERRKAEQYSNRNEITACIDCWREALAAGGWPGDIDDDGRDEDGSAEE